MNNFELTSFETPLIGKGPRQFTERELASYFKRIPVLSYRLLAAEPLSFIGEVADNELAAPRFQFGTEVMYRAYRGLGTSLLERNAFFELSNGQRKREAGRNLEVAFGAALLYAAGKFEKGLSKFADEFDAIYNKGVPSEDMLRMTLDIDQQRAAEYKRVSDQHLRYAAADPLLKEFMQAFDCVVRDFLQRAQNNPGYAVYAETAMTIASGLISRLVSVNPMKFQDPALAQLWLLDRSAARIEWQTSEIELVALVNFDDPEWLASLSPEQSFELESWCAQPGSMFALESAAAHAYALTQSAVIRVQELMPEEALA